MIASLTGEPFGLGAVRLGWYAPGDDRMIGQIDALEVRMASTPIIDETTWTAATVVEGPGSPAGPGELMEFVVNDLPAQPWYFAVRAWDESGNVSALSNSVSATPGTGILLADPALDLQGGTDGDTYTYEVTYVFPEAPTVHQVVIDGTGHDMTAVTARAGETVYRYSTTLDLGEHAYAFHFEAAGVDPATTEETIGPIVGRIVFTMGSSDTTDPNDPAYELGRENDEWQHTVVLTDSVRTRLLEVTQSDWADAGLVNPSHFSGGDLPVERITWFDAVAYCNAQSQSDGLTPAYTIDGETVTWNHAADGWRLPTEAEWEFLCRAGSNTAFCNGQISVLVCSDDPVLNAVGWYCGSFGGSATQGTQTVGTKLANDWGIYDMHGNVWEWCWDWYGTYAQLDADGDGVVLDPAGPVYGDERVVRGGGWYGGAEECRSANRGQRFPDSVDDFVGLRVVRTIFSD